MSGNWWRPARTCAQLGSRCVVQYDLQRDWLWCIRCHDPKLSSEQLERLAPAPRGSRRRRRDFYGAAQLVHAEGEPSQ